MRRIACLVLCFLFSVAVAISWAAEPITIIERGRYIGARMANKVIWIRIGLHPDNQKLAVICDSGDFYRHSEQSLAGERKPSEIPFELNLVDGKYECIAVLSRNTGGKKHEFIARTSFIIF